METHAHNKYEAFLVTLLCSQPIQVLAVTKLKVDSKFQGSICR